MISYEKYYTQNLYPFQNGILRIVKQSGAPFYLGGGTALSRAYYNKRFSDDLDLFINNSEIFDEYSQFLFSAIEINQKTENYKINFSSVKKFTDYMQLFCVRNIDDKEITLKIDIINDVEARFGEFIYNETLGKVDSLRNILSNKISAITRLEAKDLVDIWIIAKNKKIYWPDILNEAKQKEAGIDPLAIVNILKSAPANVFDSIKWSENIDNKQVYDDIQKIAGDILSGSENSLSHGGDETI